MHIQQRLKPSNTCQRTPLSLPLRCGTHRQRLPRAYSSDSSYAAEPASGNQQDLVGGMLEFCVSICSQISESAVSRVADIVQSIAPPDAPRHKIEVSVKGTLCLLVLGLLKGVINFVLLVGGIGLAVYAATQVFGCNAVVLGQGAYTGSAQQRPHQQQRQRCQNHYQRQHPGSTGQAAAAAGGGYQAGQPYPRWQQQSGWQQHSQWSPWPMHDQADVVDVTRGTPN